MKAQERIPKSECRLHVLHPVGLSLVDLASSFLVGIHISFDDQSPPTSDTTLVNVKPIAFVAVFMSLAVN